MRYFLVGTLLVIAIVLITGLIKKATAKTEIQKYNTIYKDGNFEIRYYPEAMLATVDINGTFRESGNSGFRVLAGYIFGGNHDKQKIAMTAPVRMSDQASGSTMSFVLPSEMEFENLPAPDSEQILLHKSAPAYAAVIRFGGYTNRGEIERKKAVLKEKLQQLNIEFGEKFEFLGYNAPYDMINRRNEVLVELPGFDPVTFQPTAANK